jgi:hypothetical protein
MDIARAAFTVDLTFEPCCVYYHPMTPRACYKYMCRLFRGTERAAIRGPPSPVGCAPAAGGAPTLPLRACGRRAPGAGGTQSFEAHAGKPLSRHGHATVRI